MIPWYRSIPLLSKLLTVFITKSFVSLVLVVFLVIFFMLLGRLCVVLCAVVSATVGPAKLGAADLEKLIEETVDFPDFVHIVISNDETSAEGLDSPRSRSILESDDGTTDLSDSEVSEVRFNPITSVTIIALPDRLRFLSDLDANKDLSTMDECLNMRIAIKALLRSTESMDSDPVFSRIRADWGSVLDEVNRMIKALSAGRELNKIIFCGGGNSTVSAEGDDNAIPPVLLPRKRSISGGETPRGIQSPPGHPRPPPTPSPTTKAEQQLAEVQTTERPTIHGS